MLGIFKNAFLLIREQQVGSTQWHFISCSFLIGTGASLTLLMCFCALICGNSLVLFSKLLNSSEGVAVFGFQCLSECMNCSLSRFYIWTKLDNAKLKGLWRNPCRDIPWLSQCLDKVICTSGEILEFFPPSHLENSNKLLMSLKELCSQYNHLPV